MANQYKIVDEKNMGKGNALYDFQKQCGTCILHNL